MAEPKQSYARTTYTGKLVNQRTKSMLVEASRVYGAQLTLSQGSYNPGGVKASAGTHDGGGTVDINISAMNNAQRIRAVQAMRKAGFAAWIRTPAEGFAYHIHAVAIGDREMSAAAKAQVKDYFNGRNGLANHAKDPMAHPVPSWAQSYGDVLTVPTDGKMPDLGGVTAPGATQNVAASLDMHDMAQSFGWASSFLNGVPQLKSLFSKAVKEGWTPSKFQSQVRETSWWRSNSDNARQFQIMKSTDPQTYQEHLSSAVAEVTQKAREMGAYPTPATLQQIAKDGLDFGYNDAQLTQMLSHYIKFTDDHLGGQAGAIEDQSRQLAAAYGIHLTDSAIKSNAVQIIQGRKSMEQFQEDMKHHAISAFPAYREEIEGGQTVQDLAQPYMDMMADELGQNPNSVTVYNPLIRQAMNGQDAQGNPNGMTLDDFQKLLRDQPGWNKTDSARDAGMTAAKGVLQNLGLVS